MGRVTSLLAEAGIEAAEGSIETRLISQALLAMAAEMEQILKDGRVTPTEVRKQRRIVLALAKQARAAEEAADLEASASNKIEKVEERLQPLVLANIDVRRALYVVAADRANHGAERAAGVVVLADHRRNENGASVGPDNAA